MAERFTADEFAALVENSTDPTLESGLAAVRAPVCWVLVHVSGPGGVHLHQGWIDERTAAFLLYTCDERYEFLTCGPDFGPAAIARTIRLGPCTLPTAPLSSRTAGVEALFADDRSTRLDAVVESAARTRSAADTGWQAARVAVGWVGTDGLTAGRGMTMLRTDDGIRVVEFPDPAAEVAIWTPTTSTDIWRRIVALLPGDDELAARPQPALA